MLSNKEAEDSILREDTDDYNEEFEDDTSGCIWTKSEKPICYLILAHDENEAYNSKFMDFFANELIKYGISVGRFAFPYMQKRMKGEYAPPDKEKILTDHFLKVINVEVNYGVGMLKPKPIFIGGKSLGGLIATQVAVEIGNEVYGLFKGKDPVGCISLGFPFHPAKKPDQSYYNFFRDVKMNHLLIQGESSIFGSKKEIKSYNLNDLSYNLELFFLKNCDHSFKPKKGDVKKVEIMQQVAKKINEFIQRTIKSEPKPVQEESDEEEKDMSIDEVLKQTYNQDFDNVKPQFDKIMKEPWLKVMSKNRYAFLDIKVGIMMTRRVVLELYKETPLTSYNFLCLCKGKHQGYSKKKNLHYKGNKFHKVILGLLAQAGDITKGDGTGGHSVYGQYFQDETFHFKHDRPGVLAMANCGKNTNSSQFYITTEPAPWLDDLHVVFGKVVEGMLAIIHLTELFGYQDGEVWEDIVIVDCGELQEGKYLIKGKYKQSDESQEMEKKIEAQYSGKKPITKEEFMVNLVSDPDTDDDEDQEPMPKDMKEDIIDLYPKVTKEK